MISDAGRDIEDGAGLSFDLCIVGSGPAGLTLALEMESLGVRIAVLEAGGTRYSKESQEFYCGEITGTEATEHLQAFRMRRFGGTSTAWGGRCLLYDPIDFEARDYIPDSGWPICYDTLLPYYERALEKCEAGPMDFDAASVLPGKAPQMIRGMPDGDIISSVLERWSPATNFGKAAAATLRRSASISVLLNAVCVALNLDAACKTLVSLTARAGSKKAFTVKAKTFVLAAGGIEVPRLLLASNHQVTEGIGNRHDLVGRYYMTHIAGLVGTVHLNVDPSTVAHQYERDRNSVYVRRRMSISEEAQRRERLPNISMQFHHPPVDDTEHRNAVLSAIFIAKHIGSIRQGIVPGLGIAINGEAKEGLAVWLRHFRNLITDMPGFMSYAPRFAYLRYLRRRRIPSVVLPTKQPVFPLHYHAEQLPNRNSRVVLSSDRDRYGVLRARLKFQVTRSDLDGVYRAHRLLDKHLRRYAIGHLHFEDGDPVEHIRRKTRANNGHFLGTTRMSADPRTGVVDPDCRVFGVSNLYVSSSAVFPTSSHANPTLTIVALAIRLADHLRKQFTRGGSGAAACREATSDL